MFCGTKVDEKLESNNEVIKGLLDQIPSGTPETELETEEVDSILGLVSNIAETGSSIMAEE
jgi:hypothetical protein